MIVSISENKFQILVASLIGFIYFRKFGDETVSMILVLAISLILRSIKFDNLVNKHVLKKEGYINFKTKTERNLFCKSMFNASDIAANNVTAKKWDESKRYLKSLKQTKKELTAWNKKYNKNKENL